jgi:hypothetical protein
VLRVVRIATWNLERPRLGSHRKLPGILARIAEVDADVWVLTETNDVAVDVSATHPYRVSSEPVGAYHAPGERWTTVWSRWEAERVETGDLTVTACARVATPSGMMLVYGTVLPYHADRGRAGTARTWEEFLRVTPLQAEEWRTLRDRFPDDRFCVAGDLNQSLDGRRWTGRLWYGTARTREVLGEGLRGAGLGCVTGHDLVEAGWLTSRSSIDHVCLDAASAGEVVEVGAWEAGAGEGGGRLSDHNGVWVDLGAGPKNVGPLEIRNTSGESYNGKM